MMAGLLTMLVPKVRHFWCWKYTLSGLSLLCALAVWLNQRETGSYKYSDTAAVYEPLKDKTDLRPNGPDSWIHSPISNQSDSPMVTNKTKILIELRSKRLRNVCQTKKDLPKMDASWHQNAVNSRLFINKQHRILYCAIPKIGSSFWKRLLKVVDESNSKQLHLYDMSGMSAHSNFPDSMTLRNKTSEELNEIMTTFRKFMFVRDPFARLFSSYVDKVLVPTSVGLEFIDYCTTLSLTGSRSLPEDKVSYADFCACFSEAVAQKKLTDLHFVPMSYQCAPCFLNFTFIGKMETFMEDTRDILHVARINFTDVTGDVDVTSTNELASMRDVIFRVLTFLGGRKVSNLSHEEAKERLWRHLQIRGLISKTISFPLHLQYTKNTRLLIDEYTTAAVQAYDQSGPREIRQRQREEAMLEAYGSVPQTTLEKLSQIFAEDCSLFDYSCNTDRFLNSNISHVYFRDIW